MRRVMPSLVRLAFALLIVVAGVTSQLRAGNVSPDTFQELLAAGEFTTAIQLAEQSDSADIKDQLLAQVAQAQLKFSGAQASLGTVSRMSSRMNAKEQKSGLASQKAMNGGGADFTQLINLITTETGDEFAWDEVGGIGSISPFNRGVRVDAHGVLSASLKPADNSLDAMFSQVRPDSLNQDLSAPSDLRMISLKALEAAVARQIAEGQPVVASMKNLGGLTSIQYVFVDAAHNDIILAGPSEPWTYDASGTAIGTKSKQPVMQLDDLVTVMRTFSKNGQNIFGCSIDPREAGMKDLKEYVEATQAGGALSPAQVKNWVRTLQQKLGQQDIRFYGVPTDSRVARVIIEADYRMKLIGVGKLDGGSEIPDYFKLMNVTEQTNAGSIDALRWWLTIKCDAVTHNAARNVYAIDNCSVLCQSENQFVSAQGESVPTGKAEATNRLFAQNFTNNYDQLAARDSVFADLENIFDLSLAAAIIAREHGAERSQFDLGCFAADGSYVTTKYTTPKAVDSVVNHRVFRGKDIVVQVAGGVRADVMGLFGEGFMKPSERLDNMKTESKATETQWWWDAK